MIGFHNDSWLSAALTAIRTPYGKHVGLWGNDVEVGNGWELADLGFLQNGATVTIPIDGWSPVEFVTSGLVSMTALSPALFTHAMWDDQVAYGYWIAAVPGGTGHAIYAERFDSAPRVLTPSTPIIITPKIYLGNSNVVPPPGPEEYPTGAVLDYGGASSPPGWLFCDGSLYLIVDYPALGALLADTYGGDGVTTFGVPDLRPI